MQYCSAHACPLDSTKRSRAAHLGLDELYFMICPHEPVRGSEQQQYLREEQVRNGSTAHGGTGMAGVGLLHSVRGLHA